MEQEQPMDYAVALSKTLWAAQINLAAAMENVKRTLVAVLPVWLHKFKEVLQCMI